MPEVKSEAMLWFCLLLFDDLSGMGESLVMSQVLHGSAELKWLSSLPCTQEPYVAFVVGLGISSWPWEEELARQTCVPRIGRRTCGAQGMPIWWWASVGGAGHRVPARTLSSVTLETAGGIRAPR